MEKCKFEVAKEHSGAFQLHSSDWLWTGLDLRPTCSYKVSEIIIKFA